MPRKDRHGHKGGGEDGPGGGYEVIYSGFVLILLCFFIMLSSFASIEQGKVFRFVKSFVDSLSMLPGGLNLDSGKIVLPKSSDMVGMRSEVGKVFDDLAEVKREYGAAQGIRLFYADKGLVMQVKDAVLFDLGSAKIRTEALPLVDRIAAVVASTSYPVRIEGHTDDLSIETKRFPSNWELSAARAVSVLRYCVEQKKIPAERLSAVGFGKFQPLFPNDSAENRARNRRVEIVFDTGADGRKDVNK